MRKLEGSVNFRNSLFAKYYLHGTTLSFVLTYIHYLKHLFMFPFFLCQKFSLSAQIHYKHQWFCYLLKFVQCKWKLKWSERNHFAVLLCFPGTAKQMGSKDRIRGTKTSDERMDVERCCVRVAVPKRGEFNPAGRPNAGFGVLWRNRTRCCKRDMKKLDFFFFKEPTVQIWGLQR